MNFSLPLVPFEEYMLVDDRPSHPMSFFLQLTFSGVCDPATLETSLQMAIRRHPLLHARVTQGRRDCFQWSTSPQEKGTRELVTIAWKASPVTPIDLFTSPGLRITAERSIATTELTLQFHHACCDGVGALQFCEDWFIAYAALSGRTLQNQADPVAWRPLDESALLRRGQLGTTRWKLMRMLNKQAVGLLGAKQFLLHRPAPLQPITTAQAVSALPQDFPTACDYQFTAAETSALLTTAHAANTTVNNLLIRDLFLAIGDFRTSQQLRNQHDWLRLSIPVNLRNVGCQQLSAANLVSMVFFDRQPHAFDAPATLLQGIDRDMQSIKKNQLGLTFTLMLGLDRKFPGAIGRLRRSCQKKLCRATAVLSNLGRPLLGSPLPLQNGQLVAGNMILQQLRFLPPVRPHTLVALGALTYANRLQLSLHFDSRGITRVEADRLLQRYVRRLRQTVHDDTVARFKT